ncbi:acylphosphatase [Thermotomaculum hydrothermale]|uniref:acylphosphatase n=1 Tax=Thermotomaculum hydrothermale TaxID=981385 RepID=A0A7R6PJ68_9BACT|nr:acylphosphatase [Thermotomaculum hydrothermale]BBB33549.1 acylphosphatase [Thermotomaculum hydrothermale]
MKRYLVRVYGIVPGVGFRYFTLSKAKLLGINGFVKNLPDGSVFVDCEGDDENLRIFLDYLREGPHFALVERIEIQEEAPEGYIDFEIKR